MATMRAPGILRQNQRILASKFLAPLRMASSEARPED